MVAASKGSGVSGGIGIELLAKESDVSCCGSFQRGKLGQFQVGEMKCVASGNHGAVAVGLSEHWS